jgi:hypothetical protein
MRDEGLERVLAWMASVVAMGLLGAGVYAVFYSANGSGAVALLSIGSLALFVIAFRSRIRSMEFGGARVQLAFKVRDSLKMAFRLRLAGNYEGAENEIDFAFSQFIRTPKIQRAYKVGYAKLSLKKYSPMAAQNEDRNVFSGLL